MYVLCCVECGNWQHLHCDGGWHYVTSDQHKEMRQGKLILYWTCGPCWEDNCFKPSWRHRPRVRTSPVRSPPGKRAKTSPLRDLNTAFTTRDDADSDTSDDSSDDDGFATRRKSTRDLPPFRWSNSSSESEESSDGEEEKDVTEQGPRPLTFEVMAGGGPKGGNMLVDSYGHFYKRGKQNKSGQITWVCPFRWRIGFHSFCYAQVTQSGAVFQKNQEDHTHFQSGEDVAITARAKVKQMAEERLGLPAGDVVTATLAQLKAERRWPRWCLRRYLPSTTSLTKLVATHRQALRSKHKPDAMDDFLADLFGVQEEDFADDVITNVTNKKVAEQEKPAKRTELTPQADSGKQDQAAAVAKHRGAIGNQHVQCPAEPETTIRRTQLDDEPEIPSSCKPSEASFVRPDVTRPDSTQRTAVKLQRPIPVTSQHPGIKPRVSEEDGSQRAPLQPVTSSTLHSDVTYHVIDGGSNRGTQRLVSSEGYTFTRKRGTVGGTVYWRCSVRNESLMCHGLVKQRGHKFDPRLDQHIHQPAPGAATKLTVVTKAKRLVAQDMSRPTRDIVQAMLAEVTTQVHRNLVSEVNLTRQINRHRHTLRKTQG